jgi:hypothetical protein
MINFFTVTFQGKKGPRQNENLQIQKVAIFGTYYFWRFFQRLGFGDAKTVATEQTSIFYIVEFSRSNQRKFVIFLVSLQCLTKSQAKWLGLISMQTWKIEVRMKPRPAIG